jgi:outer membrane receptor for ferric coprogen and ferric-rhodotorulic acid
VDTRKTVYAATRLNLADPVKLLLGANYTQASSTGSATVWRMHWSSRPLAYVGLVVDLSSEISAYGSVSKIFNPQTKTNASGASWPPPASGTGKEVGLKGEFLQRRLNTALSLFEVEQDNIAEQAGYVGSRAYYRGISAKSRGVEFDLSGELAHNWQASLGVWHSRLPARTARMCGCMCRAVSRLSTTWRVPQLEQLKLGASLNYQSETRYSSTSAAYQGGYSVWNLMASYDVDKHLTVAANLYNVLNRKYLTSVYWDQSYYAAPVNASVSVVLNWKY